MISCFLPGADPAADIQARPVPVHRHSQGGAENRLHPHQHAAENAADSAFRRETFQTAELHRRDLGHANRQSSPHRWVMSFPTLPEVENLIILVTMSLRCIFEISCFGMHWRDIWPTNSPSWGLSAQEISMGWLEYWQSYVFLKSRQFWCFFLT